MTPGSPLTVASAHRGFLPRAAEPRRLRGGMTLVELLVSLVVISILATLSLAGLMTARTRGKAAKTETTIRKISEILLPYYEEYETRRPTINSLDEAAILAMPGGRAMLADFKRTALRRLMTLELPERILDLNIDLAGAYSTDWQGQIGSRVVSLVETPPVARRYRNIIAGNNTPADLARAGQYDSGELLYLIVTRGPAADPDIVAHFRDDEVGDTDGDLLPEFVDGWRRGIYFKRWPIGFPSPVQPIDGTQRNIDTVVCTDGHRLVPLVYSAGQDTTFDINDHRSLLYGLPRSGGASSIGFNPFAIDRSSNDSLVAYSPVPVPPFPSQSAVLVPIRRPGTGPVTFAGCRVDRSGNFATPSLDAEIGRAHV